MAELVTQAEFARRKGWSRSYVTQLKNDGRLVLGEGGLVDVEASLARFESTRDQNRDDVAKRHARERGGGDAAPGETDDADDAVGITFQSARAIKEKYLALQARFDYERARGLYIAIDEVERAGAVLGAALRARLEGWREKLAPELVPVSDLDEMRAILAEATESILSDISRQIQSLTEAGEQ